MSKFKDLLLEKERAVEALEEFNKLPNLNSKQRWQRTICQWKIRELNKKLGVPFEKKLG